jgi:serine/threonine protein kinase
MPSPSSSDELLQIMRKSGVVDSKHLDAYLHRQGAAGFRPHDAQKFADQLVRDGILTYFYAKQFLRGKWRGFTVGKYKIIEQLGAGVTSSVFLCEHLYMRRLVAVKVLPIAKDRDTSKVARFEREARAAAALDHPNIVHAFDSDREKDLHFLVMEYVDGFSLQDIVRNHGALAVPRAAHYIRQAAFGLQHIHEAGLIHRDIKPGNLLLDRRGTIKILDLGLARFYRDHQDVLTHKYDEKSILGTVDYLSPEQALDSHQVDIRTDIYSLGATLYFLLTGRAPFDGKPIAEKLLCHQIKAPPPVRGLNLEVPEALTEVIAKMMAKDPAQRYADPLAVVDALAPWTGNPILPPPENEMPRLSPAALRVVTAQIPLPASAPAAKTPVPAPARKSKQWQIAAAVPGAGGQATQTQTPPPRRESDRTPIPSSLLGTGPRQPERISSSSINLLPQPAKKPEPPNDEGLSGTAPTLDAEEPTLRIINPLQKTSSASRAHSTSLVAVSASDRQQRNVWVAIAVAVLLTAGMVSAVLWAAFANTP